MLPQKISLLLQHGLLVVLVDGLIGLPLAFSCHSTAEELTFPRSHFFLLASVQRLQLALDVGLELHIRFNLSRWVIMTYRWIQVPFIAVLILKVGALQQTSFSLWILSILDYRKSPLVPPCHDAIRTWFTKLCTWLIVVLWWPHGWGSRLITYVISQILKWLS